MVTNMPCDDTITRVIQSKIIAEGDLGWLIRDAFHILVGDSVSDNISLMDLYHPTACIIFSHWMIHDLTISSTISTQANQIGDD